MMPLGQGISGGLLAMRRCLEPKSVLVSVGAYGLLTHLLLIFMMGGKCEFAEQIRLDEW